MVDLELRIRNKAIELGYESCGIIKTSDMKGYREKLTERIEKFPEIKSHMEGFYSFANLEESYPWAKSVVVCVRHYGKYKIPKHLEGLIAKYYLVDGRRDRNSSEYKSSILFEEYLNREGLKTATNRDFGITSLRWAAMQAGLGIVRKNNFFYTEKGSWVNIEAWLIDKDLELKEENNIKKCPEGCSICVNSCPTKSLAEAYAMNRSSCISCLNTWEGWDMPNEKYNRLMGKWIFGCDVCQNVCPFNKNKWVEEEDFPKLSEIVDLISLEKIIEMDYDTLRNIISPKFWYLGEKDVWIWKTNALNAMLNSYESKWDKYINIACNDENKNVRKMALWVKNQIHN